MAQQAEDAGGEAEARHRIRRHGRHPGGEDRVAGPDEGRRERGEIAPAGRGREVQVPAREENDHAPEPHSGADEVARPQPPRTGQPSREQDDQERPQVTDEPGFGGRREAQGHEVEGVVGEEAADAEAPDPPGLPQGAEPLRLRQEDRATQGAADQEGHRCELERGNRAGGGGEQRQSDHRRIAPNPTSVARVASRRSGAAPEARDLIVIPVKPRIRVLDRPRRVVIACSIDRHALRPGLEGPATPLAESPEGHRRIDCALLKDRIFA